MIAKDRLFLGIKKGHFGTVEHATAYANEHSLNIELRTVGRENQVQFRFVNSSDWYLPNQWKDNYERKIRIDSEAALKRFDSLGISTGKTTNGNAMLNLDVMKHRTVDDILDVIQFCVDNSQSVTFTVKNGGKFFDAEEFRTQFLSRWKGLPAKQQ